MRALNSKAACSIKRVTPVACRLRRGSTQIPRRVRPVVACYYYDEDRERSSSSTSLAAATDTLTECLKDLQSGHAETLAQYVADEVIDAVIEEKKKARKEPYVCLDDILHFHDPDSFKLDSFAIRNLVLQSPACLQNISCLLIGEDISVHRYAGVSETGEHFTLTFSLQAKETLEPQYRSAPRLVKKWQLKSVTGEAGLDEDLSYPNPTTPPEAVTETQLSALQNCDVEACYAFAAPANREVAGPLERFKATLNSPLFAPLMGFQSYEVLQRSQHSTDHYVEVISVTTHPEGEHSGFRYLYAFDLRKQPADDIDYGFCWMTHSITQVAQLPPEVLPPKGTGI